MHVFIYFNFSFYLAVILTLLGTGMGTTQEQKRIEKYFLYSKFMRFEYCKRCYLDRPKG